MNTTSTEEKTTTAAAITAADLLEHWMGHRGLTRRTIEAFPEEELFNYAIGGMRPFAAILKELLAIGGPGIRQIATGSVEELDEHLEQVTSKEVILKLWDEATDTINQYWGAIPDERFSEQILAFGQYEGTIRSTILYYIDNEIHHRAQGFVYLRALGIEPPYFWQR